MYFGEMNELFEAFRGILPYYVAVFVPIFIILSPVNPVLGAHDFNVYRMQQFDLQGVPHGCWGSQINLEARTLESSSYARRCVLAKLTDLSPAKYKEIVAQMGGGIVVFVPQNFSQLTETERQNILELESSMLGDQTQVPVYFTEESEDLGEIYTSIKRAVSSDGSQSSLDELISLLKATGYQIVSGASQSKAMHDLQLYNIQGRLPGFGIEEQLPTIIIVAHYDSFGIAPSLSFGADSNGSGVAALLELVRLFSRLYSSSRTHAKYNFAFLLSAAGKFNYQGTKKWLEDYLENSDANPFTDIAQVICLDSLALGEEIYLHVSKPPKEGSAGHSFYQNLKKAVSLYSSGTKVDQVHKKINLAEETLAWEHERFSMRRLPAFTVSHYQNHRDLYRTSILDTRERVNTAILTRNVKVIAEALGRCVYNISDSSDMEIFSSSLQVEESNLAAWLDHLSSQPRSSQFLSTGGKPSLVHLLEQTMNQLLKDVQILTVKPDKRETDWVLYDITSTSMSAYNVRHAVFDLFLTCLIAAYLCVVYFAIENFSKAYGWMRKTVKSKQN